MKKVTIYLDDSLTKVEYELVKHIFFTANNTILTIAQYKSPDRLEHHYIHLLRERIYGFKVEEYEEEYEEEIIKPYFEAYPMSNEAKKSFGIPIN